MIDRIFIFIFTVLLCLSLSIASDAINETGEVEAKQQVPTANVLNMELNERLDIERWEVLKVPGGWIYRHWNASHLVFVKDTRSKE